MPLKFVLELDFVPFESCTVSVRDQGHCQASHDRYRETELANRLYTCSRVNSMFILFILTCLQVCITHMALILKVSLKPS